MSEMIVTCAGCGKRFKGVSGPKRFKCSACGNQFTFPDSPRIPAEGTVLCSCCWTGYQASEDIQNCIVCEQRVSMQFGGRAAVAAPRDTASSASLPVVDRNRAALDTRDAQASVIKERDELAQAKRQLEEQMIAVNARLVGLKETQAAITQERDMAVAAREPLEEKIVELKTRLALVNETVGESRQALADAAENRQSLDCRMAEMQAQLSTAQDAATAASREREISEELRKNTERELMALEAKLAAQAELHAQLLKDRDAAIQQQKKAEEKIVELQTRLESAAEAQAAANKERDEFAAGRKATEEKMVTLQGRLAAADEARAAAIMGREEASANNALLEKRIVELQSQLSEARHAQRAAEIERDRILSDSRTERARFLQTQSSLKHLQDLTATALRPLGSEYSRIARELAEQTEALLKLSHDTQDELDQRRARIKSLEQSLRGQLDSLCRSFAECVAEDSAAAGDGAVLSQKFESHHEHRGGPSDSHADAEGIPQAESFTGSDPDEAVIRSAKASHESVAPGGE